MSLFFYIIRVPALFIFFFFNDPATTEIYTLSLHDALPISSPYELVDGASTFVMPIGALQLFRKRTSLWNAKIDRKSTRLNSSHTVISYAVFCLKKKKQKKQAWNKI